MKKIVFAVMLTLIAGCTDADGAKKALIREGYADIEITGYDHFGCGKDDSFHTGFKAKKNGHEVIGVFCSGWLKGGTIRTY